MTPPSRPECDLYVDGHVVHYIQAIRSVRQPHVAGILVEVSDDLLVVEYRDRIGYYRNHSIDYLVATVGIGGPVRVCEDYSILKFDLPRNESRCFSIATNGAPWVPCGPTPLASLTPDSLARHLQTAGGFLVSGSAVLDGLEDHMESSEGDVDRDRPDASPGGRAATRHPLPE
jgi:hypothetical protein